MTTIHRTPGRFVWHELVTSDVERSRRFYGQLVGYGFVDTPGDPMPYTIIRKGEQQVAGLMGLPMPDVPSHWLCYVSVEDVDGTVRAAVEAGGSVFTVKTLPVGKFAVLSDPTGAVFAVWTATDGDPPEVDRPASGTFCWDQLNTPDPEASSAFYEKVFGWRREPFYPGATDMFVFHRGERQAASIMKAPPGAPAHWITYIAIEDLRAARARVAELGGELLVPEIPVPGLGKFGVIRDDVGAVVALFEPG